MPEFVHKQFKTVLNKLKYIDNWFWTRYSINPYNGCQFGCIYCDGRSERYRMREDFSETIVIKDNIGAMLENRLKRARTLLPDVVGFGGVTDGYQPVEKKVLNTQAVLTVLQRYQYPVHLLTKSNLILRDIDVIDAIGQQTWAAVSVTLTTLDTDTSAFLEPRAAKPKDRLDVIRQFKKRAPHVQTGFLLMPIIPGLTDGRENLKNYLKTIQDAGADYCLFSGLTLRDRQADYFLKQLHSVYPAALQRIESLYQFSYEPQYYSGQYTASSEYYRVLYETLLELCDQINMPIHIKRFIPNDFRKTNYRIAETLLNEAFKGQLTNKKYSDLYWAGQHIQNLSRSLEEIAAEKAWDSIPNVGGRVLAYIQKEVKPAPRQTQLFD